MPRRPFLALAEEAVTRQRTASAMRDNCGMIPEFEVAVEINFSPGALRTLLDAEDIARGFTDHHEYFPVAPVDWSHVEDCVAWEAPLLAEAAASAERDGPNSVIDAITDDDDDSDYIRYMELSSGLDLGVVALVMALGAAGVATFYSCASSLDHSHHARFPMVGCVPDRERAQLIAHLAKQSGCGIGQSEGLLYIYARTVTSLHELGRAVLEQRDDFDRLAAPAWATGLREACARLGDQ